MAAGTHLLGGRLNLGLVREAARAELREILGDPLWNKIIVWDDVLIGPVGLVAEVPFLMRQGVTKMVRLPVSRVADQYKDTQEFIFIARPKLVVVERIIEAIGRPPKGKIYTVVFVPYKSVHACNKLQSHGLIEERYNQSFRIKEFHLDMLPLEQDVISLDINTAFTDLYLDHDPTPVHQAAKAIAKLQTLFGTIPHIYGKGRNAALVAELMERTRRELLRGGEHFDSTSPPQIDAVVLLDRSVDLITPLSTQLTYEGLIDEVYGIKYETAKFPRETFSEEVQQVPKNAPPPSGPLNIVLNSEESMFVNLRDVNFLAVGRQLSTKAKEISAAFQERHDAKTVQQLKQFVQKLPHMQQDKLSLSKHTTIAELIKNVTDKKTFLDTLYSEQELRQDDGDKASEYIVTCMGMGEPIEKVLRLMCLQSVACNGLKQKLLDRYRTEIVQRYGASHLVSLVNLERCGLLRASDGRSFANVRKNLRLIMAGVSEHNPKDISYVFSGYAPLSIRIVEQLEKANGWQAVEELLRIFPGPMFSRTQSILKVHQKRKNPTTDHPLVVLVFFLGGCSYAEISALRYLAQRDDAVVDYVIGTTNITCGTSLIKSILKETPTFRPSRIWDNQMGPPPSSQPSPLEPSRRGKSHVR